MEKENHKKSKNEVTGNVQRNSQETVIPDPGKSFVNIQKIHGWTFYFLFYSIVILSIALRRPETRYLAYAALGIWVITCSVRNPRLVLRVLPLFLSMEGTWKILTNYNPIAHIGIDLGLGILFLRVLSFKRGDFSNLPPAFRFGTLLITVWILLHAINPYGLGFIPSLAGLKLYLFPPLIGGAVMLIGKRKDFYWFSASIIVAAIGNGILAYTQYKIGDSSVLNISHLYLRALRVDRFIGPLFRPVGTGVSAGYPAIWIFFSAPFILWGVKELLNRGKLLLAVPLIMGWLPIAVYTLMTCQIRSAMIKTFMALFLGILVFVLNGIKSKGSIQKTQTAMKMGVVIILAALTFAPAINSLKQLETSSALFNRFDTLKDTKSIKTARTGPLELLKIMGLVTYKYPLGLGPARTGAASAKFGKQLRRSYPVHKLAYWAHDNFYLSLLIEIGLPGFIIFFYMIFSFLPKLSNFTLDTFPLTMLAFLILFGQWAAMSMTYNPESTLFWVSLGFIQIIDGKRTKSPLYDLEKGDLIAA